MNLTMRFFILLTPALGPLMACKLSLASPSGVATLRQEWTHSASDIRSLIRECRAAESCVHKSRKDAAKFDAEGLELETEMEQVLSELRNARFCQGCSQTARELQAKGIHDVEDHFAKNGGTRPATPQEIEARKSEFVTKIDDLRIKKERSDSEGKDCEWTRLSRSGEILNNASAKLNSIEHEIIRLWHDEWNQHLAQARTRILDMQPAIRIAAANYESAKKDKNSPEGTVAALKLVRDLLLRQLDEALETRFRQWHAEQELFAGEARDFEQQHIGLIEALSELSNDFMFSASTLSTSPNLAIIYPAELRRPQRPEILLNNDIYVLWLLWARGK